MIVLVSHPAPGTYFSYKNEKSTIDRFTDTEGTLNLPPGHSIMTVKAIILLC